MHCGDPVSGQLFLRQDCQCCCENCYLDQHLRLVQSETGSRLAEALAAALDLREHETGLHSKRVACHTLVLAKRFTTDPARLEQTYWGALLHDVGKIGIRDAVLLKNGPLTKEEWVEMRTHPQKGHALLASVPAMAQAASLVLAHEERFDGSGYPLGLKGEEIPQEARLFAIIDTLDAITSDRPYRPARTFNQAVEEIVKFSGSQFDPLAVEAFVAEEVVLRRMVELKCVVQDGHVDEWQEQKTEIQP